MPKWLNEFNSTNAGAVVSLALAILYVAGVLAATLAGKPLQAEIVYALGGFLLAFKAGAVAQYGLKRFSDYGLAAAKASGQGPPPQPNTGERGAP